MVLTDALADSFHRTTCDSMRRAIEAARTVNPASACADLTGGIACFAGEGSPFTQVAEFGYREPAASLDEVEAFYKGRAKRWEVNLSPFTSPHLFTEMARRGYVPDHFESVLAMRASVLPPEPEFEIEVVDGPGGEWAATSTLGWGEPEDDTSRIMAAIPGTRRYLARVDGKPAGIAAMTFFDEMVLFAGGAVLPEFRGRGLQSAFYARRIRDAGVGQLLTVTCIPGSSSHRNAQRAGFEPLYSKLVMMSPTSGD